MLRTLWHIRILNAANHHRVDANNRDARRLWPTKQINNGLRELVYDQENSRTVNREIFAVKIFS